MTKNTGEQIRRIYDQWHATTSALDLDGLMALYAENAVLETPTVFAMYEGREEVVVVGKGAITDLFSRNLKGLSKQFGELHRSELFLSDGKLLLWEYQRKTPQGEQIDLVESMDIEDGLIVYHRVYWGWKGYKALMAAAAKRG